MDKNKHETQLLPPPPGPEQAHAHVLPPLRPARELDLLGVLHKCERPTVRPVRGRG